MTIAAKPIADPTGVYRDHPALGQPVSSLATPVALVDLPILEHNIRTMADFFAMQPANLRPHAKTHRTPVIAHMQLEAGANGITVPKTSVGEALVDGGIEDVFVANQVVAAGTIKRLVELAKRAKVSVLADDARNVTHLSEAANAAGITLDVLVEIDGGMNRCGTQPGKPTVRLVEEIVRAPGLRFAGVHLYEGHVVQDIDRDVRVRLTHDMLDIGMDSVELIRQAGIDVETVTCGGTGTYDISGIYPGVTEHQSGSYVYMDPGYAGKIPAFALAFSVLSTVLSCPTADKVIVDSGLQVLSTGGGTPAVKDHPDLAVRGLSEEHGIWLTGEGIASDLAPGDQIEVYPGHCCAAANLHDTVYAVRDGVVEGVWAVTARGLSQ